MLYNVISNVFGVTSGVAVVLRLLARYFADSQLWLDDWTILLTMAIGVPSSVINVHGRKPHSLLFKLCGELVKNFTVTSNGLGKDIWTLSFKNISDMIHVRRFLD